MPDNDAIHPHHNNVGGDPDNDICRAKRKLYNIHYILSHNWLDDDNIAIIRRHLSAAIDLLDHNRQPVDGSPPDAAD